MYGGLEILYCYNLILVYNVCFIKYVCLYIISKNWFALIVFCFYYSIWI